MLRRTAKASFAADAWVFPGGRIDPGDGADPGSMDAARQGAARETLEEAGVVVDPQALIPFSQWCPPPESPKRFLTWFFVAGSASADEVTVDGAEITEHEWVRPADAIAARDEGRITLLPPTWVTLWELGRARERGRGAGGGAGGEPAVLRNAHRLRAPRRRPGEEGRRLDVGGRRGLRDERSPRPRGASPAPHGSTARGGTNALRNAALSLAGTRGNVPDFATRRRHTRVRRTRPLLCAEHVHG